MKADRYPFRLRLCVPGSGWWRGESEVPGGGPLRSMRRRIRRLGASPLPIHPCVRGGERVGVQRDLSKVSDTTFRHDTGPVVLTYEICVVGVRAQSDVGVRCITFRHVGGEFPELSI